MLKPPFSFEEIMAPLGAERFFAEYEGKRPLHLKGAADKFAQVMTWAKLNDLLGQATIWTDASLLLWLDKEAVAPARYREQALGRDGRKQVLQPDPEKVKDFLRRGATLTATFIDHLSTGLTAFASALEEALLGKVQANLYLSSRRRQGLASHRDRHDVYAVHVEGTKTWHVYEGRSVAPIAHPMFKTSRAEDEQAKQRRPWKSRWSPAISSTCRGANITTRWPTMAGPCTSPSASPTRTVWTCWTWSTSAPWPTRCSGPTCPVRAVPTPRGRRSNGWPSWPRGSTGCWPTRRSSPTSRRCRWASTIPGTATSARAVEQLSEHRYRVQARGLRLVQQGGRFGLVREGSRAATEVPADVSAMVGWVLERPEFSLAELAAAFPERQAAAINQLLRDLGAMHLLRPA